MEFNVENFFEIAQENDFVVVAEPNGAGKSNLIKRLLSKNSHVVYQNPDEIQMLDNLTPHGAGMIVLNKIKKEYLPQKKSVIYETTISGNDNIIREAAKNGYNIKGIYGWLWSPDQCVERVGKRVKMDKGHNVPIDVIFRHYFHSVVNLSTLLPLCVQWAIYDGGTNETIAWGAGSKEINIRDEAQYKFWETKRMEIINEHKSDLRWTPSVLKARMDLVYNDILFQKCYGG